MGTGRLELLEQRIVELEKAVDEMKAELSWWKWDAASGARTDIHEAQLGEGLQVAELAAAGPAGAERQPDP